MIRFAAHGYAEEMARIHVDTWREAYAGIVPQSFLQGLSKEKRRAIWETFLTESPDGAIVAVSEQSRVVGWASFGPCRDEDGVGLGELYGIYLLADWWGHGYGRAMVSDVQRQLAERGFSVVVLWVLELNARGRRFYETAGFAPDGAQKTIVIEGAELNELRYRKAII